MSKKRAFTLVELLVVIAIIALLMSILIPALSKAKKQAITVLDHSNMKQMGVASSGFTNDNDSYLWKGWQGTEQLSQWWMDAMRPYYGNNKQVRCCPLYANPDGANVWNMCYNFPITHLDCPDYGSYGVNGWVENAEIIVTGGSDNLAKNWKTTNVKGAIAKDVPLLFEEPWIDAWPRSGGEGDAPGNDPPPLDDLGWQGGDDLMMARVCRNWHKDGYTNMLFLDLSARRVGLKELWVLKWHRLFDTEGKWGKDVRWSNWPTWMRDFKDYAKKGE
jgi:prepilin-type N-terminal cleavage/methylation domain-containing protein